jgi:hypothetical protein
MTEKENNPVMVFAGNALDAGMIQSLLEEEGIPAFVQNELMGSIAPWQVVSGGAGAVKVLVAYADQEKAVDIIKSYNINEEDRG